MYVFVINKNGKRLDPCKPAKARHLRKDKKAKVVDLSPFTIQLLWDCEEHVELTFRGYDVGSEETGFCIMSPTKGILLQGTNKHRTDVKKGMDSKRGNRKRRRSRLWYRKPRFDNRASSRKEGRLTPTAKTHADEIIRLHKKIPLPPSQLTVVEDVLIDIARINNSDLEGKEYQEPKRLDENLRLACLMRDGFRCFNCGKKNAKLHAHHIIPKSRGGKNTLDNLVTLCEDSHKKLHKGEIELKGLDGGNNLQDVVAQRTMQGKKYLYDELEKIDGRPVEKVFGYETSEHRKRLGLEKTHAVDAFCILIMKIGLDMKYNEDNNYKINYRSRQTRKVYHDLPQKGKGRTKYQVNEELGGFRKGDIVKVKGKWRKQVNSIYSSGRLAFKRISGEPGDARPKDCRLLLKTRTIIWTRIQREKVISSS